MRHLSLVPGGDGGELRFRLLPRCELPPPGAAIDCAVSGGADSLALLVLAVTAGCQVTAWHVDHGLRPGSAAEVDVVAAAADRYGAQIRSLRIEVSAGPNLEDRARRARFDALPAGVCTGHTAEDQAETMLLALLRGAGLDGLTGMGPGGEEGDGRDGDDSDRARPVPAAPSGPKRVRHPLLGLRRAETAALCEGEGLVPVVDPTNDDLALVRNRVRHQLLPLAAEVAGRDVVPLLARTAALLRADAEVLGEAAAVLDPTDASALAAAPSGVARRAVRGWLATLGPSGSPPYPPTAAAVERVLAVARGEALACEVASVGRVARHRRRLVVEGPQW